MAVQASFRGRRGGPECCSQCATASPASYHCLFPAGPAGLTWQHASDVPITEKNTSVDISTQRGTLAWAITPCIRGRDMLQGDLIVLTQSVCGARI